MNVKNAGALVTALWVFGGLMGVGLAAHAHAHPGHDGITVTVDGVDYPVCAVEDCSDQPGQVGVWNDPDTGRGWLSVGEVSYLITL